MRNVQTNIISYDEAVKQALAGTDGNCPHLEGVNVWRILGNGKLFVGKAVELPLGNVENLGPITYVTLTDKSRQMQDALDEYMNGEPGSCKVDCIHYKDCNPVEESSTSPGEPLVGMELRALLHSKVDFLLDEMDKRSEGRQGIYDLVLENHSVANGIDEDDLPLEVSVEKVVVAIGGYTDGSWHVDSQFYTRKAWVENWVDGKVSDDLFVDVTEDILKK